MVLTLNPVSESHLWRRVQHRAGLFGVRSTVYRAHEEERAHASMNEVPTVGCHALRCPAGERPAEHVVAADRRLDRSVARWTNGSLMRLRVGDAGRCEGAAKRVVPR